MAKVAGGCFCGTVRYEADGTCSNTMVCHCQSCRRVVAAPVVAWVKFGDGLPTFREFRPQP